jgi:hypothetical protein
VEIPYVLYGDNWGSSPHQVEGIIVIPMAGPNILVQTPNGGETWAIGDLCGIDFIAAGGPEFVRVELDRGGAGWELLAEDVPAASGTCAWNVTGPISAHCLIRVTDMSDPGVTDTSDAEFTIYRSLEWIQLDRYEGQVAHNTSDVIQMTLDAQHLPTGTYEANIIIESNAGDPVVVPVTLFVDAGLSEIGSVPRSLALSGVHPNPFNPRTTIDFSLPRAGFAQLTVYDVTGKRIRTLLNENLPAGDHQVVWDGKDGAGRNLASGTYFCRLEAGGKALSLKMLLLK